MDDPSKGFDGASDVTHSTAFLILDSLIDEGQLVEERANFLKEKFRDLHSRVLSIYKRDNTLLKRARELRTVLDEERQRVQSKREGAQKDDQEIQRLKNQLIVAEQELTVAQERESVLQVEALEYDRKKQNFILEKEDAVAAEEARLRPKLLSLQEEINEMGGQIKTLVSSYEELLTQQKQVASDEAECKEEIVNYSSTLAHAKQMFSNVEKDPDRAKKQLELVTHSLSGAAKELSNIEEKIASQDELIAKLELKQSSRSTEVAKARENLETIREELDKKRKALATLNASLEVELETRQAFQDRLTELDHVIKATKISSTQEMDGLDRVKREKEKLMKDFTNIEQATDRILYEIKSLEEQVNLIDKDISNIQNKRKDFERQIADAKANVTARSKLLLKEQSKEKDFTTKANTLMEEIEELEELLQQKRKQEDIKEREHVAINKKLTGATRECAREASRVVLAKNELRMKEMYYQEIVRRHEELEKRLDSILEVFHAVKRERGQKATQIQSVTQKMTEVAEKTKILENELEVLIRESVLKEKELVRKKRQTHEVTQSCAMLRLEKSKQKKNLELTVEKEQEIKSEVRRTNTHVAQVEESMINFRNMYEDVVDSRNQAGVNLIDRNDELALLVEKVKAQEVALEHGVIITNARAEDIRRLKIHLGDLLREVKVCQSSLPKVKQLEEELAKLTEEIEDERWKTEVIEKDLTDPNNTQRWRKIEPAKLNTAAVDNTIKASIAHSMKSADSTQGAAADGNAVIAADGSEPMPVNAGGPSEEYIRLQAKCQDLESRMNDLNEKLREKELIYAEVSELSDRVGSQAESGKEHTLQMAKQVNQYQSNMRNKTRQIMSTIAELSLFQSSSIQAQQEVQRLEEIVAQAEERMAAGEAPFLEAEEEYEREKQSNERYAEQLRRNKERQNGVEPPRSTAEVRPTAYIPDGDLLGVPRPYGNHAPFKPSAPPGRFKTSNVPISSQNRRDEVGNYSSAIDGPRHQASTPPPVAGGQLRLSERAETPPPRGSQ